MNDDEFRAMQEENEQKADLAAAIEDAKALGLDAEHIMAESRAGYKNLQKLNYSHSTLKKPLVGKDILNQTGIFSERHGMIQALRNAVKKAKGES
jgi:hypothetical protein